MNEKYITITGFNHYYGLSPFEIGAEFKCTKEPENIHDMEAIEVTLKPIGVIGYVANSPYTTAVGTMSAGRIYDKIGDSFRAKVMFITANMVICRVLEEEDDSLCN